MARSKKPPARPVKSVQQQQVEAMGIDPDTAAAMTQGSFKRGGTVPKTGTYRLHKGERVIPARKGRK